MVDYMYWWRYVIYEKNSYICELFINKGGYYENQVASMPYNFI